MSLFARHRDPVPRELAAWERQVRDRIYGGPRTITVAPIHPPIESPRTVVAAEGAAHQGAAPPDERN